MNIEDALNEGGGIIATNKYRELRNQFSRAVMSGRLIRLYPRVLVASHLADDPAVRARAALIWQPRHVLMGPAAARVTFWPTCPVETIDLAGRHLRSTPHGTQIHQISVPYELRMPWAEGFVTIPEVTVLDLAVTDQWGALCEALRQGRVSAQSLESAAELISRRAGKAQRLECLRRAQDNPWSVAEMDLHLLYRRAGINGWVANRPVKANGRRFVPDLVFEKAKLIVEVDGRQFHSSPQAFHADRERDNCFVSDGWIILRFTPAMIWNHPEQVIEQTLAALACRRRDKRRTKSRAKTI